MRRWQQLAEWLAPQHIGTRGRIEPIGRVRLPTLELKDGQRPLIALDVFAHPGVQPRLVDPVSFLDRLGSGKFLVVPDAFGHGCAPLCVRIAGPRARITSPWWERSDRIVRCDPGEGLCAAEGPCPLTPALSHK